MCGICGIISAYVTEKAGEEMTTFEKDFIPMGGSFYRIPANSNLRWMMMFYALPREFVEKWPAYLEMPRRIREVIKSEKWMGMVNSDAFLELIWDSYAWTGWQFFKVPCPREGRMQIPGSVNHYSGDFPLWRYSYMLPSLILQRFEVMKPFTLQTLFLMGRDYEAPWSAYETFYFFIGQLTREIIGEHQWQPEFDAVWENRTHEDYNGKSIKQQDFERSWNHSRAPKQNRSMDEIDGEQDDTYSEVMKYAEKRHQSFENRIAGEDFVDRFKASLSDVDRKIIELREAGMTLAEIAEQVGFAGAGTVSKHLCQIGTQYKTYAAKT